MNLCVLCVLCDLCGCICFSTIAQTTLGFVLQAFFEIGKGIKSCSACGIARIRTAFCILELRVLILMAVGA